MSSFRHQRKQLKFIVSGGAGTYFTDALTSIRAALANDSTRIVTTVAVVLGCLTILDFAWLIVLPWIRNVQLDYAHWRASPELRTTITRLTLLIVCGWSLLLYSLSAGSDLGFPKSLIGSISLYVLSFGLLGLIPVPRRL